MSEIIEKAKEIIDGDREKVYGNPSRNLDLIAGLWGEYIKGKFNTETVRLNYEDVCLMMAMLKIARLTNTPGHEDSLVDLIGYAALIDKVKTYREVLGILASETYREDPDTFEYDTREE